MHQTVDSDQRLFKPSPVPPSRRRGQKQVRERHGQDLVRGPIDTLERAEKVIPLFLSYSRRPPWMTEAITQPTNEIIIGDVPDPKPKRGHPAIYRIAQAGRSRQGSGRRASARLWMIVWRLSISALEISGAGPI